MYHANAAAAAITAALLTVAGVGLRTLEGELERADAGTKALLDPAALARVPLRLGDWRGEDVAVDARLRAATDTDALLNRRYRRPDGGAAMLYVAYGTRIRDMAPHRPEVCYPAAGWILEGQRRIVLASGALVVPARVLDFRRSGFAEQRMIVVNYVVLDGVYHPDSSALRQRSWQIGYAAQVQIAAATDNWRNGAAAREIALAFAADALAALDECLTPGPADPTREVGP